VYVLDTCIVRYWTLHRSRYPHLVAAFNRAAPDSLYIATITVVEVWRGSVQLVDSARRPRDSAQSRLIQAYAFVDAFRRQIAEFAVLPYDEQAHAHFLAWQQSGRINKRLEHDYRIAAIAAARGYSVVTANTKDFAAIPGVRVEDWTRAP
jgi:predicted nucleic acid-binding protein